VKPSLLPRDSWRLYRRLFAYALPYKWMFAVAFIGMVLLSISAAGFTALMKPLVDDGFVGRDPQTMRWVPFLIVALFVLRGVANYLAQYANAWVGKRVTYDIRDALFRRLVRLPSGFYESHSSGSIVSKLIYDVEQLSAGITQAVFVVVSDGLTLIALFSWLLLLNWKLTLLFVVLLPFSTVLLRAMSRRFRVTSERIQTTVGDITQVTQEAAEGQRVIKAYGGQAIEVSAFEKANEQNRRQSMRRVAVSAIGMGLLQVFGAIALAAVVYVALYGVQVTAGEFTSYIAAATWMMGPSRRLARVNETIQTALAAAASSFALLDEPEENDTGTAELERVEGRIVFSGVTFRYPGSSEDALADVSFRIEPGQTVALVGASGSGKTTCASLLPRFYRVEHGEVSLDGVSLNAFRLANLRRHIALVGQESLLFNDTIRNNIVYGCEGPVDEERLRQAAHAAHVMEFAQRLPDGLDAPVGERGSRLSGGQRQRIAIARALYKNAPILILDEATSALDTESERWVQDALRELMRGRSTLVIAHRLSTVEHADRIVVLARGRIVESGSHRELLERDGAYAALYRNQFRDNPA
jgi:subfamily B ATP-binding cassette protein MsbA